MTVSVVFWNVGCAKFNLTFSPAKGLQQFKAPGIHDAVEKEMKNLLTG
jgi:hypothetical protein